MNTCFSVTPIAHIHTPYREKFAIPRQPGLVSAARGVITFTDEFADPNCVRGIEQFSHLWLIFQFHQTADKGWTPLVRPPRLGGNEKIGVFATRSTFRPNGLGMSVVPLLDVTEHKGRISLLVQGPDLLDGTPIVDIKPYIPYVDAIPQAAGGFADHAPDAMAVAFSEHARKQLQHHAVNHPDLEDIITQVLAQDPRPAYKKSATSERIYGVGLFDLNIRWQVTDNTSYVIEIVKQVG